MYAPAQRLHKADSAARVSEPGARAAMPAVPTPQARRAAFRESIDTARGRPPLAMTRIAAPVVQRVTNEQDEALKVRLEKDGFKSPKIEYPSDSPELAIVNGKYAFRWIQSEKGYWRRLDKVPGKEKQGSFFGRLEKSGLSLLAQTTMLDSDKTKGESLPRDAFTHVTFAPTSSEGGSRATGEAMGKYFFGQAVRLPASTYLLGQPSEWLHLRADSLGGDINPANLFAGGSSANSWMAAFEKALAGMRSKLKKTVAGKVQTVVDQAYHSERTCLLIVAAVNTQRTSGKTPKKPLDSKAAEKALASKESHKLKWLRYGVVVDGKEVYSGDADPATPGKFDTTVFEGLLETASAAMLGQSPGPLHKLDTSKTSSSSSSSSSASSAPSSFSSLSSSSSSSASRFSLSPSVFSPSSFSSNQGNDPHLAPSLKIPHHSASTSTPPSLPSSSVLDLIKLTSSSASSAPPTSSSLKKSSSSASSSPAKQPPPPPKNRPVQPDSVKRQPAPALSSLMSSQSLTKQGSSPQKQKAQPQPSSRQPVEDNRMQLLKELALLCWLEGQARDHGRQLRPDQMLRIVFLRKLLDL